MSEDIAISCLRNSPKEHLKEIILQLERELHSRQPSVIDDDGVSNRLQSPSDREQGGNTLSSMEVGTSVLVMQSENSKTVHREQDGAGADGWEGLVSSDLSKVTFTWLRAVVMRHLEDLVSSMQVFKLLGVLFQCLLFSI